MSYGAFVLGFGIGLTQALVATVVGAVVSFFLVGLVSIAGKRGSAPTLVLSRAAFGRVGNGLPGLVSYLLLVGWETVLVSLSTLATATVFERLGWASGDATKVVAFVVVACVIVAAGMLGFDAIMKIQLWLTIAMIIATAVYVYLTFDDIDLDAAQAIPDGPTTAVIGATVLVFTAFGLGLGRAPPPTTRATCRAPSARPASSSGRRSAAACRSSSWSPTASCSAPTTPTWPRPSAPTRSAR